MDPLGPPLDIPIPARPLLPILNVQMHNAISDNKNIYVFVSSFSLSQNASFARFMLISC